MGETFDKFKELTAQYFKDMDATFQAYEKEKEQIGKELAPEVKAAVDEVTAAVEKCFEDMKNLTRTFMDNLTELSEGDHPDQDLPSTGPIREPLPKPEPQ